MVKRAAQKQDKFIIRLPDGMRDQIRQAAEASNRTMTAEIVARLRMTFDMAGDTAPHDTARWPERDALEQRVSLLAEDLEFTKSEIVGDLQSRIKRLEAVFLSQEPKG